MSTQHFVYILRCVDNTLYCGYTTDIKRRLRRHNGELVGGARYTRARRPVRLVYQETCPDRATAQKHEHQIKQLSRQQKEALLGTCSQKHKTKNQKTTPAS